MAASFLETSAITSTSLLNYSGKPILDVNDDVRHIMLFRILYSHEPLRQLVKYVIYPLIGILDVSEAVSETLLIFNSEPSVVVAGIIAASLIGLVYFTPP
ncbi:MAG: hypothetical protein N3F04_03245 [Candidatus Nezhaarchaeota archaeon]|nr:hypothetical protein [Candidatus Nezhaarchaeota archaeon]MCX8141780.1 hypothetical protein [Candidatus Nezhaarchaeota archaeon]MDW8050441.1 hypothetical protein [Nitrososphaerota archaeon]